MNSKIVGGSVGIVMIGGGFLIAWGGLSGSLASILAALFAPSQLVRLNTKTIDAVPGFFPPNKGNGTPQLEEPPAEGVIVPPDQLPGGSSPAQLPGGSSPVPYDGTGPLPPDALPPGDIPGLLPGLPELPPILP